MLELAEQGRVGVAAEGEDVKKGRLVVRDPTPTGDAVLDQALQRCSERSGQKPQDALSRIAKDCGWTCSTKLAERSILRGEKDRILGIFPTTRWPAADSRHEGEIREGHWAAEAVGAAIQAVQTAVSAAVMTAAITSSAGSNGG